MEENFDALEVIARTRGKVEMDQSPRGGILFVLWGTLTAVFFLLEFLCWRRFQQEWCLFLWAGMPILGMPVMYYLVRKDHERTHIRTRGSKLVLNYWMLAGVLCFLSGFALGFSNLDIVCFYPIICMLVGIGAFLTGEVLRYRPMILCGLGGCLVGLGSFLLQGQLWPFQLVAVAVVAVVSLIAPGYFYDKKLDKDGI